MTPKVAMILTAGLGTRLRPATMKTAKPAIPVMNVPMLAYPLFYLEQIGVKHIVMNTHHLPETVEAAARSVISPHATLQFSHESPIILGNGGGIAKAKDLLRKHLAPGDNFIVANGDSVTLFNQPKFLTAACASHTKRVALATILTCEHPKAGNEWSAVWIDPTTNAVLGFGKEAPQPGLKPVHSIGFQIFSERLLPLLRPVESNIFHDNLKELIAQGEPVYAFIQPGVTFFETGNEADYMQAHSELFKILLSQNETGRGFHAILDRFTPGWNETKIARGFFAHSKSTVTYKNNLPEFGLIGAGAQLQNEAGWPKDSFLVIDKNVTAEITTTAQGIVQTSTHTFILA